MNERHHQPSSNLCFETQKSAKWARGLPTLQGRLTHFVRSHFLAPLLKSLLPPQSSALYRASSFGVRRTLGWDASRAVFALWPRPWVASRKTRVSYAFLMRLHTEFECNEHRVVSWCRQQNTLWEVTKSKVTHVDTHTVLKKCVQTVYKLCINCV